MSKFIFAHFQGKTLFKELEKQSSIEEFRGSHIKHQRRLSLENGHVSLNRYKPREPKKLHGKDLASQTGWASLISVPKECAWA